AAAAARVFGLSAAQVEDAFGIALSQAAGSLQFLANGAWTKRFQVGWSALNAFPPRPLRVRVSVVRVRPLKARPGSSAPMPRTRSPSVCCKIWARRGS
ncbi:MAG: MmgE/PrpD family protein, partial [Alphaproteobacteria bacterium]